MQPALWSKLTVGNKGPYFSFSLSKATPKYYPSIANERVPLFIFKKTPRTPYFLNGLPYFYPLELELCLS